MKSPLRLKSGVILRNALVILLFFPGPCLSMAGENFPKSIKLPEPRYDSGISVERALTDRRSVRHYGDNPVSLEEVSQMLWAAQGVTDPRGFRTAPSAGALYPLEVYILAGNVRGLAPGIYRYTPQGHVLEMIGKGDRRMELSRAALGQRAISEAPAVLVICCVYRRTTEKYGQRGVKYAHMEVGHAAQNICLQAVSLGLGAVGIGAFSNAGVKAVLTVGENREPLYIIPFGRMPEKK